MKTTVLAIAAFLIAPFASAIPQCDTVDGPSETLVPEGDTQAFLTGVNISLLLALTPSTFPEEQINAVTASCTLGSFVSDEIQYSAFVSSSGSPPIWATDSDESRIAFLAIAPPPKVATEWYYRTGGKGSLQFENPPIYVAAITDGDSRDVYAFYHSLPSDEQIIELFEAALAGDQKRLLRFDTKSNKMEITSRPKDW
ncbi:MAG: hypothetical protein AAGF57_20875 [Pseudomonadota bacterium]